MATLPTSDYEPGCIIHCGDEKESSSLRRKNSVRSETAPIETVDDTALAQEMNELTVEERDRIAKEICGVPDENEEAPDFLASCSEQMDVCLSNLSRSKRGDLDRAFFLKPRTRKDEKFKLMFLRCENYDAKKAAERMARYFTFKRDLFGEEKLVKKITLDDLDEEDLGAAKGGRIAFRMPKPDRAGRPVLFVDATRATFHGSKNLNRFRFYSLMAAGGGSCPSKHDSGQVEGRSTKRLKIDQSFGTRAERDGNG